MQILAVQLDTQACQDHVCDPTHVLCDNSKLLPSGMHCLSLLCKINKRKLAFISDLITLVNSDSRGNNQFAFLVMDASALALILIPFSVCLLYIS